MSPRTALILIVGLAAVIEDLGWRRISNWTSGGAVLAGLVIHTIQKGWQGLLHSFLGALIGFGVFLIFYLLGGMGGGDVKLMAGFGALLGDKQILPAALLAAGAGGVMALGVLLVRGTVRQCKVWLGGTAPEAGIPKSAESIPYAPAITLGALLALVSDL
jgi:prepilin peptidase CpaA